jgi:hypothetical protein
MGTREIDFEKENKDKLEKMGKDITHTLNGIMANFSDKMGEQFR